MVLNSQQLAIPSEEMSVPKPSQEIASRILEEPPEPWIQNILYPLMLSEAKMQNK